MHDTTFSTRIFSTRARGAHFSAAALVLALIVARSHADDQDQYAVLARAIGSPTFTQSEQAKDAFSDAAVMLRMEMAYQLFSGKSFDDSALEHSRTELLSRLASCHYSMEEIRRLDNHVPDITALATKGLQAAPGIYRKAFDKDNVTPSDKADINEFAFEGIKVLLDAGLNAWNLSSEQDKYRTRYREARRQGLALKDIAAARCKAPHPAVFGIGIEVDPDVHDAIGVKAVKDGSPAKAAGLKPGDKITKVEGTDISHGNRESVFKTVTGPRDSRVSLTYQRDGKSTPVSISRSLAVYEPAILSVDINGSWAGFYSSDYVFFTNMSGRDLTNVTLFVTLSGRHDPSGATDGDRHLHYIDKWPAGQTRVVRYLSQAASGIASNESVDQIDTVKYELYSSELRQDNSVAYTGEAYDADVERYVSDIPLIGSWRTYAPDDWMYNSGFLIQSKDGEEFPCSHVTVRAYWGDTQVGFRWTMKSGRFPSGTSDAIFFARDRYFCDPAFNKGRPDRVEVVLEFPYSDYKAARVWNLRP